MIDDVQGLQICTAPQFIDVNGSAVRWHSVHPPTRLRTPSPYFLAGAIDFDDFLSRFGTRTFSLPDFGCLEVDECDVVGYGVVVKNKYLLLDANFTLPEHELGHYGYFTDVIRDSTTSLTFGSNYSRSQTVDTGVLLIRRGDTVHGHWILEILPRIATARSLFGSNVKFLVSAELHSYQLEMLAALGIGSDDLVKVGRNDVIHCSRLIIPSVAHTNNGWLHPSANTMFDELVGFVDRAPHGVSNVVSGRAVGELIFVTRASRPDDVRPVFNINVLQNIANDLGFTIVDPGTVDWIDQIKAFSSAKVIVGLSGSGMHNTAFTGSRAHVLTLQPNQSGNFLQTSIAAIRGHSISYLFGESLSGFDSENWNTPYVIDKDLLRILLKNLMRQTGKL